MKTAPFTLCAPPTKSSVRWGDVHIAEIPVFCGPAQALLKSSSVPNRRKVGVYDQDKGAICKHQELLTSFFLTNIPEKCNLNCTFE